MRGETLADILDTIIRVLGVLSVFFAGWLLSFKDWALCALALFLFICGTFVLLAIQIEYEEKGETTE